jgi:hypothetical protein
MKCHLCPHQEAILRGDYDSKPWNETPFSDCKLGEDNFFSIPFDEDLPTPATGFPSALTSDFCPPVSGIALLPAETLARVCTFGAGMSWLGGTKACQIKRLRWVEHLYLTCRNETQTSHSLLAGIKPAKRNCRHST